MEQIGTDDGGGGRSGARGRPLHEEIASRLGRLIADRDLREGDRMPSERELAVELGVSRPSVREAVRTLEARGRVAVRPGIGVFVRQPAAGERLAGVISAERVKLHDLFQMRLVLEVPAAGWAANAATEAEIRELAAVLGELEQASERRPPDYERLKQLDSAFHMGIATAAGNPFLAQTMEVLQRMLAASMETTLKIPGRLQRSRVAHQRILAALEARDPRGAERAMRGHIEQVEAAARARINEQW
jgi:GntR family transcriptional repressor for pyruvate dehydrogenase complex